MIESNERDEILSDLKASKGNNVVIKGKNKEKYSFTILDLIKDNDGKVYSIVKPPIDFPNAKANSVLVFAVRNGENCPCAMRALSDKSLKMRIFEQYNERKKNNISIF